MATYNEKHTNLLSKDVRKLYKLDINSLNTNNQKKPLWSDLLKGCIDYNNLH